jgi:hypothetical protein
MRWAVVAVLAGASVTIAACGSTSDRHVSVPAAATAPTTTSPANATGTDNVPQTSSTDPSTTATTVPCSLSGALSPSQTVPIDQVCSSTGAPHFATPQAAMTYLAGAWNAGDVQEIDYVTDPNGRQELDSMASVMANLRFEDCTPNPAGDYTCYFMHAVTRSTSPTTYPNPMDYPPGEAVFTVAAAEAPGWYLTNVLHCG